MVFFRKIEQDMCVYGKWHEIILFEAHQNHPKYQADEHTYKNSIPFVNCIYISVYLEMI